MSKDKKHRPPEYILSTPKQLQLQIGPFSTESRMYREIVKQVGIISPKQKLSLRKNISYKYKKHLSMIQAHQQRVIKFAEGYSKGIKQMQQKKLIKNDIIILKQQKVLKNKNKSLKDKSKKVQETINKWKFIRLKNLQSQKKKLQLSKSQIDKWNSKCSSSLSRKSLILNQVSQNLRQNNQRVQSRQKQRLKTQQKQQQKLIDNYESADNRYSRKSYRNLSSRSKVSLRVSTQVISRKKQKDQADLEKSLFDTVQKSKRITQARVIKAYLQSQRRKRIQDKQIKLQQIHKEITSKLSTQRQQRNKILDSKYKQNRKKMRQISLPAIRDKKLIQQQNQQISNSKLQDQNQHKYQRIIMDKLRNMSIVMKQYLNKN